MQQAQAAVHIVQREVHYFKETFALFESFLLRCRKEDTREDQDLQYAIERITDLEIALTIGKKPRDFLAFGRVRRKRYIANVFS